MYVLYYARIKVICMYYVHLMLLAQLRRKLILSMQKVFNELYMYIHIVL